MANEIFEKERLANRARNTQNWLNFINSANKMDAYEDSLASSVLNQVRPEEDFVTMDTSWLGDAMSPAPWWQGTPEQWATNIVKGLTPDDMKMMQDDYPQEIGGSWDPGTYKTLEQMDREKLDKELQGLLSYTSPMLDIRRLDTGVTGSPRYDMTESERSGIATTKMPEMQLRRAPISLFAEGVDRAAPPAEIIPGEYVLKPEDIPTADSIPGEYVLKPEDVPMVPKNFMDVAVKSDAREFARTFNPQSTADVKTLQGFLGLKQDGILGPKTEKALRELQGVPYIPSDIIAEETNVPVKSTKKTRTPAKKKAESKKKEASKRFGYGDIDRTRYEDKWHGLGESVSNKLSSILTDASLVDIPKAWRR